MTDEGDYPPEKSRYLLKTSGYYQQEALKHGEHVRQVTARIMTDHAYRNLRKVQALFRLADKYGSDALNLTCRRSIFYEDYRISTIKRILHRGLYSQPLIDEVTTAVITAPANGPSFVREAEYFLHAEEETL